MAIETIDETTTPPKGTCKHVSRSAMAALDDDCVVTHCYYQPNVVSQYNIVFTQYRTIEGQQQRINLTWLQRETGGVTFNIPVSLLYRCSVGYVMEKTGIENEIDAVYLLLFLKDQGFCIPAFDNGDYTHYVNSPVQRTIEYP